MSESMKPFLMAIVVLIAFTCTGCESGEDCPLGITLNDPYHAVIGGTLIQVSNPPMQEPPLPCIVGAIDYGETTYILTTGGTWICPCDELVWNGAVFKPGDAIEVEGMVVERLDVRGNVWISLEIEDIR